MSPTTPVSFSFPPLSSAPSPSVIDASRLDVDFSDAATRIGVGTYGSVHVARYFGELVAVKRVVFPDVSPLVANDPYVKARRAEALHEFANEIRKYERVSHPGIVRFLGVTLPPDSSALLVTELMHGGSLGDALDGLRREKVSLGFGSFARICLQTCGGLRALHAADCTWGDAKPENVLLSATVDATGHFPSSAQARISDFGLSKSVAQNLLTETTVSSSGQPAGTYNYMAPETFSGLADDDDELAKKGDVYSFGMVMYEMLTLRTPWKRTQMIEVYTKVFNGARPEWPKEGDSDYHGPVPDELKELVEKCWSQEAKERPTAEEVFYALEAFSTALARRAAGERPVHDISGNAAFEPEVGQFAMVDSRIMARVPSKQSSASTAVAVGDASVDMQGSILNSSRESGHITDEEHTMHDSLTGTGRTSELNAAPRVSPVTSPEPRSLNTTPNRLPDNRSHGSNNRDSVGTAVTRSAHDGNPDQLGHRDGVMGPPGAAESLHVGYRKDGEQRISGDFREIHFPDDIGANLELPLPKDGTPLDEGAILEHFNTLDLQEVPTFEFEKRREEIAVATAEAAVELSNVESSKALGIHPRRDRTENTSPDNIAVAPYAVGNTLEGSIPDMTSSTASSASLRRKRSKRLQSIIEHCAMAFLEIRRREEMTNKMPPKQRKEAADKRAMEEARLLSEQEALRAIEGTQATVDISVILVTMKQHRESRAVVKAGMLRLERYCRDEIVYFDICEEGGIEELLSGAVRFGQSDSELCVSFCNSMTALSEHYDDKVGHLVRATGVPSVVVELLDWHKTSIPLQIAGCSCLAAIAGASELSRSAVATLGGPAAVYRAMTKNNISFKDVDLARASLRAVRQIAQDNERAAEFLVQVAALDAVSKSAAVFTDHGLESDILATLRAFSFYTGGRRNIIMSSGLKALAEIMLRNEDPEFFVLCCQFIRAIAQWRNVECEEAMLQSCIAERVTTLMQNSKDRPGEAGAKVAWYACQACLFLASFGSQSRKRLRQVGAIETAISILNNRRENARVARCATDALAELLKGEPEAKVYAERAGAFQALNSALDLHKNDMKVRSAVQWTLDCLSSAQGANIGPAHGSQVHQELMKNGSAAGTQAAERNPRRFLGFLFTRRRNHGETNREE